MSLTTGMSWYWRPTPEGVGHQLLGQRPNEHVGPRHQRIAQRDDPVDLGAVGELSRRIQRNPGLTRAPGARRIEILEREPEGIHHLVAPRAGRTGAVPFHALTQGARRLIVALLERGHVGKWRRWRRAEHVLENPFAAEDRCGPIRPRRHHQQTTLTEQAAPRIVGQRDLAEVTAVHVTESRSASRVAR